MRIIVIGLVAVLVSATAAAAADVGRSGGLYRPIGPPEWCNQGNYMTGGVMECSYHTLQQCLASQSGVGGTCIPNPWYEWARYYQQRPLGWRY